jgi:phospholipid/cholesterol/gamma-HCH transport system permease protein
MPRVLAFVLVLPALTALADVCGLTAGSIVVYVQYDIPIEQYFSSALQTVELMDFLQGMVKSAVFGLIISAVGCHKGFTVEGGTEGVGKATTETVAITSVTVCLSDFFLTKLLLSL